MRGAVLHAPGDIRVEERQDPTIEQPTDADHPARRPPASAARTCGPTAASKPINPPTPMGHEYVGIVEEVGDEVTHHQAGPVRRRLVLRLRQHLRDLPGRLPVLLRPPAARWVPSAPRPSGCASRWPTARWSPRPGCPPTTWSRACWRPPTCSAPAGSAPSPPRPDRARPSPSSATVRSACSACWPPSSSGAERIIAMSRHEPRQRLAREFGATDIVTERGDEGVAAHQGPHRRARRALGHRGGRHPGVDDAGHPVHPARRARRLRRCRPRRRAARRGAVLLPRAPARRPGAGAPLPARADRPDLEPRRSTPARSST